MRILKYCLLLFCVVNLKAMQFDAPKVSKLISAAQRGDCDAIQKYVAAGGDINAIELGYSALMKTVLYGHEASSQLVLQLGINPNFKDTNGNTILFYDKCPSRIFKAALEKGADPNIQGATGKTILTDLACYQSRASLPYLISLLLKYRAKIDIPDKDGKTALDYATNTWLEKFFKMEASELEKVIARYQ